MRTTRLALTCVLALLAILSVSAPASAITYGTPDTTHTFVGLFVATDSAGNLYAYCSGSLVSARVFLTAGHCADYALYPQVTQRFVTFATDVSGHFARLAVSAVIVAPGFTQNSGDPHDVGVVILAKPAGGITPGNLAPSAGYLDQLATNGALVPLKTTFQVVGYGMDQNLQFTNTRETATEAFLALESAWLSNSENHDLGFAGGCFGDSGGPVLYTSGTTQYIVSVMSAGDMQCRALDKGYRVDTAESLSFILAEIAANA